MDRRCYGIDFGTTNTRIAYFDGNKASIVPATGNWGKDYQIPSVVGIKNGKAVAFGREALIRDDVSKIHSIKWIIDREDPLEIEGHLVNPIDIITEYFKYIVRVVEQSARPKDVLANTAVTVPVKYSYRARESLTEALSRAGIGLRQYYHEPIAALYCDANFRRMPGVSAVLDWGGGTLDVAVVRYSNSWVQVLALEGIKRGGDDFDLMLMEKAMNKFFHDYPNIPVSPEQMLDNKKIGSSLKIIVEDAKKDLSRNRQATISRSKLFKDFPLYYDITRDEFEDMIEPDIRAAISSLKRSIKSAGCTDGIITHILMSGGTCNIPVVQSLVKEEYGFDRVINTLKIDSDNPEGDIANATAIGAAMMLSTGVRPVFVRDIGVRMADVTSQDDRFYTVFNGGDEISFGTRNENFFIANPYGGVARLLICDRLKGDINSPQGTLKKILTVPVDRKETQINVNFNITPHLALRVDAGGVIAKSSGSSTVITDLAVGFKVPEEGKNVI